MKKKKTEAKKTGRIILNNKQVVYSVQSESNSLHVLMQLSIKELEELVKTAKLRQKELKKEIKDLDCFMVHPFLDLSILLK